VRAGHSFIQLYEGGDVWKRGQEAEEAGELCLLPPVLSVTPVVPAGLPLLPHMTRAWEDSLPASGNGLCMHIPVEKKERERDL